MTANRYMTRLIVLLAALSVAGSPAAAQEILTASELFGRVSDTYGGFRDYIAELVMTDEHGTMSGTLYYKRPNMILVEFTNPADQILVSDGEYLRVYIPSSNVVHEQSLAGRAVPADAPGGMATEEGLTLMRRNYDIAYLEGPDPVPLDPDSEELVTKLRLERSDSGEGYRELILSIAENLFIRRIEGVLVDFSEVTFDFLDIQVNQSIPQGQFDYDPPPSASINENFLFRDAEG
jgi:outer membrane lipoprotein-sorting protein